MEDIFYIYQNKIDKNVRTNFSYAQTDSIIANRASNPIHKKDDSDGCNHSIGKKVQRPQFLGFVDSSTI